MKRLLALLLAAVMTLSLCACGGGNEAPKQESGTTNEQVETSTQGNQEVASDDKAEGGIAVDEGLLSVEITMPATFFEEETEESIKASAEENGFDNCTVNEDGSVTYKMSKAKHKEMLAEMKTSIDESIADMLNGEEAVESFVKIEYADDLSKFDVYVDPATYTEWDSFYALAFYIYGAYYQAFEGKDMDSIDVVVNFINNETNETVSSGSYADTVAENETAG